jgi:glycine cleavage system regulatory protein
LTEIERVQTGIEVEDVEHAHRDALAAVTEAKGRVTKSEIKQMAAGQFTATLNFEVAPEQAGPVRDRLKQLGRTARLEVDRVQQAEGGTPQRDSKVKRGDTQFLVQFYNLANIAPRESAILQLAAPDVPTAYRTLVDAVSRAKGRVIASKLDENDRENVNAQLDFEVRRSEDAAIVTALAAAGETISRNVNRAADTENVTDGKVLYRTTFVSAGKLRPREVITLGIEVENVDATIAAISSNANEAKGRVTDSNISRQPNGKMAAVLAIDVPHSAAPAMSQKLASLGAIKKEQRVRNSQAPQGQYSTARFEVVLANRDALVAKDEGFGAQVRKGLSYSAEFLLKSMTWIVFGLCVVLPWAIVGYGVYRVGRWLFRSTPEKSVAPTPTPPPAGQ